MIEAPFWIIGFSMVVFEHQWLNPISYKGIRQPIGLPIATGHVGCDLGRPAGP